MAAQDAGQAPKGKTAYFVFCELHRASVREELLAGKEEGAKCAVAEEAKALGQKWKDLTDEERQTYKNVAAKNKQAELEAKEAQGAECGVGEGDAVADAPAAGVQAGLPISVVRRIITCDKEVGRVSKEATVLIAAAAEVFLEVLTEGCGASTRAARPKRRTIKLDDFAHTIRSDRRFVAAGMRDVVGLVGSIAAEQVEEKQAAAETTKDNQVEEGEENNDAGSHNAATRGRGGPAKKARTAQAQVPASNTIMSFFARIPSAPMSSQ